MHLAIMTTLPTDYNLYLRAREWLQLHQIILADEDAKELDKSAIIEKSAFGQNILIRGARPSGRQVIFAIVPHMANFTKPEVKKLMSKLPTENVDIIVASATESQSLEGIPYVVNVTHEILSYNVLRHCLSPHEYSVMRDEGIARVKYDLQIESLGQITRIKPTDPMVFWAGLRKGDVVNAVVDVEDTCKQGVSAAVF